MKIMYKSILLIMMGALLPGCGRIIDWGKANFYQGKDLESFSREIKPFVRSVTIYDQLETKAIFDVLWLSDAVRTMYAQLHTMRQGKNEEKMQAFLRRQLEENNHYITFYVLSTHEVKLGFPDSQWSLFLMLDGREYYPFEVKEIDLPYEYQVFFGDRWNRFKVPYLVRFKPETDEDSLLAMMQERIVLMVRSAQKEHAFIWPLLGEQKQEPVVVTKKQKKKKMPKERYPRKPRS